MNLFKSIICVGVYLLAFGAQAQDSSIVLNGDLFEGTGEAQTDLNEPCSVKILRNSEGNLVTHLPTSNNGEYHQADSSIEFIIDAGSVGEYEGSASAEWSALTKSYSPGFQGGASASLFNKRTVQLNLAPFNGETDPEVIFKENIESIILYTRTGIISGHFSNKGSEISGHTCRNFRSDATVAN